jgi:hypothetical protein
MREQDCWSDIEKGRELAGNVNMEDSNRQQSRRDNLNANPRTFSFQKWSDSGQSVHGENEALNGEDSRRNKGSIDFATLSVEILETDE